MLKMGEVNEAISRASINRSKLIFIGNEGTHDIGSFKVINLNKALSALLISTSRKDRARLVPQMLEKLIADLGNSELVIQGIEILFDRSLLVDPIRLLENCSKNTILLVSWPGNSTDSALNYAEPSHPEYRTYKYSDLTDVIFLEGDA